MFNLDDRNKTPSAPFKNIKSGIVCHLQTMRNEIGFKMKHKTTNELYTYWNRIRGTRLAPNRSAIEPADIRHLLKDTFILNVENLNEYTFRLAGTRTCALFGRELKSRNFLDFLDKESREAIQTLLHTTTQDATVNVLGLIGKNTQGQSIPLEALLLPLKLHGKTDQRIIGSLSPLKMPYWAGGHPIKTIQLSSLRMIMPHQHKVEAGPTFKSEENENAMPSIPFEKGRRVGHLTVIDGGQI